MVDIELVETKDVICHENFLVDIPLELVLVCDCVGDGGLVATSQGQGARYQMFGAAAATTPEA